MLRATGREAESFETTVRRYAEFPSVRPTLRNRLNALGDLLKIIVTPASDMDRFAREAMLPVAPDPTLSIDHDRWLAEHAPRPDVPRIERPSSRRASHIDFAPIAIGG